MVKKVHGHTSFGNTNYHFIVLLWQTDGCIWNFWYYISQFTHSVLSNIPVLGETPESYIQLCNTSINACCVGKKFVSCDNKPKYQENKHNFHIGNNTTMWNKGESILNSNYLSILNQKNKTHWWFRWHRKKKLYLWTSGCLKPVMVSDNIFQAHVLSDLKKCNYVIQLHMATLSTVCICLIVTDICSV